jgi:hypothetical protein
VLIHHLDDCEPTKLTVFTQMFGQGKKVTWDTRNFPYSSWNCFLLSSSQQHNFSLISRMFISTLGANKGLKDPAIIVFVAEESKPGTMEKKPKHMKSHRCHHFWGMTISIIIDNYLRESWLTPCLRVLNPVNRVMKPEFRSKGTTYSSNRSERGRSQSSK